jgi:O-antigen/teichoic acid export membrane protein
MIMTPGIAVFAGARVLQSHLIAADRTGSVILSGVLGLAASGTLQILLSPTFGAIGAAVAISLGYMIAAVPIYMSGTGVTAWLRSNQSPHGAVK